MERSGPLALLFALGALASCATSESPDSADRSSQSKGASGRNVYSPEISKDAYVIEEWAKTVGQLEKACAESGQHCEEAKAARAFLDSQ